MRLLSEVPEEEGTEEGGAALGGTTVAPDADAPADAPVEPEAPGGVEVARQLMSIALQRELGTGAEASSASAIWRSSAIVKEDAVYDTGLERMQTPQEYFDTSSSEEDDDDDDDDEDEDEDDDEDADGSFSDGSSREYSREGGSSGQRSQEMDAGEGSGGQGSVASGQYAEGGSGEGASPVAGSPKGAPVQLELPRDRFKASQQVGGEDDGGAE